MCHTSVIYFHAGSRRENAVFKTHESSSAIPDRGLRKKKLKEKKKCFFGMCCPFMTIFSLYNFMSSSRKKIIKKKKSLEVFRTIFHKTASAEKQPLQKCRSRHDAHLTHLALETSVQSLSKSSLC